VLAAESGEPVAADALRHGAEVTVATLPAPAVWRTGPGLELVGPGAFGYDAQHANHRGAAAPPTPRRDA
jgi:DUF917 family protein